MASSLRQRKNRKTRRGKTPQRVKAKNGQPAVLWSDMVGKDDAGIVGGKGANLGECINSGLPVPPFFCVTRRAFEAHLREHDVRARAGGDFAAVRRMIVDSKIAEPSKHQMLKSYRRLGSPMVAVRSSATAEDSASASFAGQLDTCLGVLGETALLVAVKACWASLFSERVASYANAAGGLTSADIMDKVSCCVVVQLMVDADAAGVAFTANPLTQAPDQYVVTANYGLGESVVADMVSPDTWIIDPESGKILSETINRKLRKVVLDKGGHRDGYSKDDAFSRVVAVPVPEQSRPSLPRHAVALLASTLCTTVANHYGSPQDIEWAWKGGKFYLLQARPITTLGKHAESGVGDEPSVNEFDNDQVKATDWVTTCNAQEMFPGPGTPLTISTFGKGIEYGMQRLHVDFGVLDSCNLDENPRAPWFYGHFFINMTNVLAVAMNLPLGDHAKANAEMSLLGRKNELETLETLRNVHGEASLFRKCLNSLNYAKTMATAPWRITVLEQRAVRVRELLSEEDNETSASLYARIADAMPEYHEQWADGILTSSSSAGWMLLIMKLIAKDEGEMWTTEKLAELSTVLADAAGNNVESADAVRSLNELTGALVNHPRWSTFVQGTVEEAREFLESRDVGDDELCGDDDDDMSPQTIYRKFIQRHGHRCIKEAELRNRDWEEDPTSLVKLLQGKVSMAKKHSGSNLVSREHDAKGKTTLTHLLNTKWAHVSCYLRPILRIAVSQTRAGVARREYGKSLQIHVHSSFKRAYRRLGKLLETSGILPDADLLYFFTHEELGSVVSVRQGRGAQAMVQKGVQRRHVLTVQKTFVFDDLNLGVPQPVAANERSEREGERSDEFKGTPVSVGKAIGKARVVRTLEEAGSLQVGEILVCPFTDVGWTPYFSLAAGLVTEIGGLLSHGAVVAREYGLPCVVNVKGATRDIRTGDLIQLDGAQGKIQRLVSAS
jgi:rifampicin phosphotransferase